MSYLTKRRGLFILLFWSFKVQAVSHRLCDEGCITSWWIAMAEARK
jgi:hypothetical protein